MTEDKRINELISNWLEETAPARLPERVLDATFDQTRRSRQHVGWRALLARPQLSHFITALGGAAVVLIGAALALGLYANQPGVGGPVAPAPSPTESNTPAPSDGQPAVFVGNWEASDPPLDSSHLTMEVSELENGMYELTIRDDFASVCDGASSTMTGVAEAQGPDTIVIAQPDYTCDDGSEAQALSGPPLEEQLRNLSYTYDSQRDELDDSLGLVWTRAEVAP